MVRAGQATMRETIFSTEIHSVEYEKPSVALAPGLGGTVFFDDIGEFEFKYFNVKRLYLFKKSFALVEEGY